MTWLDAYESTDPLYVLMMREGSQSPISGQLVRTRGARYGTEPREYVTKPYQRAGRPDIEALVDNELAQGVTKPYQRAGRPDLIGAYYKTGTYTSQSPINGQVVRTSPARSTRWLNVCHKALSTGRSSGPDDTQSVTRISVVSQSPINGQVVRTRKHDLVLNGSRCHKALSTGRSSGRHPWADSASRLGRHKALSTGRSSGPVSRVCMATRWTRHKALSTGRSSGLPRSNLMSMMHFSHKALSTGRSSGLRWGAEMKFPMTVTKPYQRAGRPDEHVGGQFLESAQSQSPINGQVVRTTASSRSSKRG